MIQSVVTHTPSPVPSRSHAQGHGSGQVGSSDGGGFEYDTNDIFSLYQLLEFIKIVTMLGRTSRGGSRGRGGGIDGIRGERLDDQGAQEINNMVQTVTATNEIAAGTVSTGVLRLEIPNLKGNLRLCSSVEKWSFL